VRKLDSELRRGLHRKVPRGSLLEPEGSKLTLEELSELLGANLVGSTEIREGNSSASSEKVEIIKKNTFFRYFLGGPGMGQKRYRIVGKKASFRFLEKCTFRTT